MTSELQDERTALLAMFDAEVRRGAAPDVPGARVEAVGGVVRQVGGPGESNAVLHSDLAAEDADRVVREQCAYLTGLGHGFEWKLYAHDRPAHLPDVLRAAGLCPGTPETVMVAPAAATAVPEALPEGVRIRTAGPGDIDAVCEVHERAFGRPMPGLRDRLTSQLAADEAGLYAETVVVTAEGPQGPVSAARLELPPRGRFAGLWGGGTLPGWRGRGVYRSLIAHRAAVAVERGYTYLYVDASEESRPILERLGFVKLTTTIPYAP
ncbi:GNAT family N-acetyltransferase [Streptomyces sulphureus]|uniref:GNAT family N-acetyltransferase n=1 Tax=Streptomyces sulphureus TaxID=47758 RepID=UPI0003776F3E|nr:GNAT family N-acetyltransferase [Streptomyces sulphureus]